MEELRERYRKELERWKRVEELLNEMYNVIIQSDEQLSRRYIHSILYNHAELWIRVKVIQRILETCTP